MQPLGVRIGDPYAESPQVPGAWKALEERHRLKSLRSGLGLLEMHRGFAVERAGANGHITVSLRKVLRASERGEMLRKYESWLNEHVAPGLKVYVQAQEDKNRLRRLRGVVVKGE